MVRYCIRKLVWLIFSLLIIVTSVFCLLRQMPIETYFKDFDSATPLQIETRLEELGLNDPLPVQLKNYFLRLLQGDLGTSDIYREGYPVAQILRAKMFTSMKFGMAALFISLPMGILLGVLMAAKKGKWPDRLGTAYIIFVQAVPAAIYFILIQLCGTDLFGWSLLYRPGELTSAILPVLSMSLPPAAGFAMWMRRFMLDEMNRDYVMQARAKGMSEGQIALKHILRNALVPMSQQLPGTVLLTLSGSIYIESLYSIPGMGGLLIEVIQVQDNTMVQGIVLVYACIGMLGMFLGDVCMAAFDPRINLEQKEAVR